jgi:4-amino-4-deoxy-L-arabinose transferase-like glycosyltransferase
VIPRSETNCAHGRQDSGSRRITSRVLWAVAAVCILVRLPSLWMSPSCDEAIFATVGNVWLRHGGLPYRDVMENKPPGVFLVYGLSRALLGSEFAAPRALAALAAAWTGVSVALIADALVGGAAGVVAGAAFGLLSAGAFTPMAYSDTFMLPFAACAMLLGLRALERPEQGTQYAAWAGLCLGGALLFKQVALADAAAVALAVLLCGVGWPRRVGMLLLCALAPLAVAAAYLWHAGILSDAYQCIVGLLSSSATVREGFGAAAWRREAAKIGAVTLPLGVGVVWLLARRGAWDELRRRLVLLAWLLLGMAAALGARRFAPNQLLQPLPALCALGGAGLTTGLCSVWRKGTAARTATVLVALVILGAASLQAPRYLRAARRMSGQDDAEIEARQIAGQIAGATTFDEPIYVADLDSRVYVYADRMPAFKVFNVIFTRVPELRHAAVQALEANPPRYIVVQPRRLGGERLSSGDLAPLLASRYRPVETSGQWTATLYRRTETNDTSYMR